jgi:3-deoxy-D-manno-octulosonic acid kinase
MAARAACTGPGGGVTAPSGYTALAERGVRALVRTDLVGTLAPWLLATPFAVPRGSEQLDGGRGAVWRLTLPDGVHAVLRCYRRGGFAARLVRETYLGLHARPFRELMVTMEARRRGVAAPEVLAARVEGRLAYRGAIVTAEVTGTVTMLEALRQAADGARRQALASGAGHVVAAMHRAGVSHADLNLTNLLTPARGAVEVTVLDFDRARLASGPLGPRARRRNLRRLARSLRKLDPGGRLAAAEDVAAFHAAYSAGPEAPCAS